MKTLFREEAGQNLVEFAVGLLIVLALIFGIIDFGRALFTYDFVAHAAREGSRYAMVRGDQCDTSSVANCPITQDELRTYLQNEATGNSLNSSKLTATVQWPKELTGSCGTDAIANSPGCTVQVTVTYNFGFIFPLLPPTAINMSSTSEMVISR